MLDSVFMMSRRMPAAALKAYVEAMTAAGLHVNEVICDKDGTVRIKLGEGDALPVENWREKLEKWEPTA